MKTSFVLFIRFQNQLVCGGAGDAAVLPGMAELFAEARRSGLHGVDQRGTPPQPRHEGPHRQGGKRSRVHPQQDEGRRCPAGKTLKNKSSSGFFLADFAVQQSFRNSVLILEAQNPLMGEIWNFRGVYKKNPDFW